MSVNIVASRETKSNIDITQDLEPVLDMTFSTSSIEPRSIVSYGILGTLGRGTYGKVLLAYLKKRPDGDLYAVKMLRKTEMIQYGRVALAGELDTLQMVANASSLDHIGEDGIHGEPFLQRLADHFQDDKFYFIVLEYHPTTLSEPETASRFLIQERTVALSASVSLPSAGKGCRSSSISYEEATSAVRLLAAEISLGLLFLHRNSIVHQDIKPANIMISSTGHAVIGDFGAASRLPSLNSSSSVALFCPELDDNNRAIVLQPEDFITFTPLYAAPEMRERNLEGLVVYDERADWWSLGVLLYELVTGNAPFNSSSGTNTLRRLRRSDGDHSLSFGHLEKLSFSWRARGDCCVQLESLLRSLLFHNPNDRLSGQNVLRHQFFDPIQALWDEILALKHPPCPNPPISPVENDVSLDFDSSYETHYEEEELDNEVNLMQQMHGDNFIQSTHCVGHSKLPDEEAVWDRRGYAEESDTTSLIQAMPSSASVWFNPGLDSAINPVTLTSDVNHSTLHISMDTFNMVRGSVTMDRFFTTQWASTLQPHPSNTLGQPADWPSHCRFLSQLNEPPYCAVALPADVALPDKITVSMLEAMDIRDCQETTTRIDKMQQRTARRSIFGSRKLIKTTVRWTWKKLHFW